jgi:hypothetical protein
MVVSDPALPQVCPRTLSTSTELELLLVEHQTPVSRWGYDAAKTIDDLLGELRSGESRLHLDGCGRLLRAVAVVGVDILFVDPHQGKLRLVETKQTFRSGRQRTRNLRTSLGEKQLPGETPRAASSRAIEEELGLSAVGLDVREVGAEVNESFSTSYPGLRSVRHLTYFECVLPPWLYEMNGYVERQADKTTNFAWREAAQG